MQTVFRPNRQYWGTLALGAGIGVVYLIGFVIGGKPLDGVIALAIMVGFSGALYVIARRSETVRGLLDRRDERITAIDLRATAVTALAMIGVVLVGFVVEHRPRRHRLALVPDRRRGRARLRGGRHLLPDPRLIPGEAVRPAQPPTVSSVLPIAVRASSAPCASAARCSG